MLFCDLLHTLQSDFGQALSLQLQLFRQFRYGMYGFGACCKTATILQLPAGSTKLGDRVWCVTMIITTHQHNHHPHQLPSWWSSSESRSPCSSLAFKGNYSLARTTFRNMNTPTLQQSSKPECAVTCSAVDASAFMEHGRGVEFANLSVHRQCLQMSNQHSASTKDFKDGCCPT